MTMPLRVLVDYMLKRGVPQFSQVARVKSRPLYASDYTAVNEGEYWEYVMIPHNAVLLNMGFLTLTKKYRLN